MSSRAGAATRLSAMNRRLGGVMTGPGTFATAVCGMLDVGSGQLWLSSAGGPEPLLFRMGGGEPATGISGLPMGLLDQGEYNQIERQLEPGDRLLLFSDGAVEISNRDSEQLGTDGLLRLLRAVGYPAADLDVNGLEQQMLAYSNGIRFNDDLTLFEISLS